MHHSNKLKNIRQGLSLAKFLFIYFIFVVTVEIFNLLQLNKTAFFSNTVSDRLPDSSSTKQNSFLLKYCV